MRGEPGEGVGGPLRVLQEDMLGYLQLEGARWDAVPGEPRGDRSGEARGVHIARGDVDGDRHLQAHRAPARHLGERGLQDVLRQPGHQPGGLGDGDELVRWHPAAVRVHPTDQRLQSGDMPVEADLGLVVQLDIAGIQGAAQIAQQAEPVRGVAVPLGLVELDTAAVALGLVHRHIGAAQQSLGVEGVVGEDGDPRAGFEHEGQSVEVQRGAQGGDEMAGRPLGAGEGVGGGQQDGELVAAEPGRLGAAREGVPQPVGDLEQQAVADEVAEGVVDGAEAVQVDEDQRRAGADALGVVQGGPGALQQPLAVGQSGERVAQLLLGAGAGYPECGVQRDQRDREQRQQQGAWMAQTAISGEIPSRAMPTSACRTTAVRGMAGSWPVRGVRLTQSRPRLTRR